VAPAQSGAKVGISFATKKAGSYSKYGNLPRIAHLCAAFAGGGQMRSFSPPLPVDAVLLKFHFYHL